MDIMGALQNRIGPLEAWQWGALAGGGILAFRLITHAQSGSSTGSVTLTPNTQSAPTSGNANETVGSILTDFTAAGYAPSDFTITLPDGTTVHFTGGVLTTTPPASSGSKGGSSGGGSSGGDTSATPPISAISAARTPAPSPTPRIADDVRPATGVTPMPTPRSGGAIPGAQPAPYPGYVDRSPIANVPAPRTNPTINPGVTVNPIPGGR